jgi:hypothetical protein
MNQVVLDVHTLTKIGKNKSKWRFTKLGAFFGSLYLGISLAAIVLVSQDYGVTSSALYFVDIFNDLVSLIIFPVIIILGSFIPTEYSIISLGHFPAACRGCIVDR